MVLIIISVLLKNFLLAAFALFAMLTLFILGAKKPGKAHYALTKSGIVVDTTLYPYSSLDSFWIREEEDRDRLVVKTESYLSPYLIIPLNEIDPDIIRDYLLEFLDEEEHFKTIGEKLVEYIKL